LSGAVAARNTSQGCPSGCSQDGIFLGVGRYRAGLADGIGWGKRICQIP